MLPRGRGAVHPGEAFRQGKTDPAFRTQLQIGAELGVRARKAGFTFRAVATDSAYGDQDGFRAELAGAGLPFVMALKPRRATGHCRQQWHPSRQEHRPRWIAPHVKGPDDKPLAGGERVYLLRR